MNKLNELCKQFKKIINYIPTYCSEQYEEFKKHSQLCRLINAIVDLSDIKTACALDDTIKEIAYMSPQSNYEIRRIYLSEAIKDLLCGIDKADVILKYDEILYKNKGVKK